MQSQNTFSQRLEENRKKLLELMTKIKNEELDINSPEYKSLNKMVSREHRELMKEGKLLIKNGSVKKIKAV